MSRISRDQLQRDFSGLGIGSGDTVLIRATLGAVGRVEGGAAAFIDALLDCVGETGTIVSLAFTGSSFLRRPKAEDAFTVDKKSYAGALPNAMLIHPGASRSRHPTCSYVAIGRRATEITKGHDENSGAYEPVRKIVELDGKCVLVGCVDSSPGFTTAHLAEADLGYLRSLPVFPSLNRTFYIDANGSVRIFKRKDPGLCSNSFYKFYALYVKAGILKSGFVGRAYSISVPARASYDIEFSTLKKNRKFNICDSPNCWTCNVRRWDRIHRAPFFLFRLVVRRCFRNMNGPVGE